MLAARLAKLSVPSVTSLTCAVTRPVSLDVVVKPSKVSCLVCQMRGAANQTRVGLRKVKAPGKTLKERIMAPAGDTGKLKEIRPYTGSVIILKIVVDLTRLF